MDSSKYTEKCILILENDQLQKLTMTQRNVYIAKFEDAYVN